MRFTVTTKNRETRYLSTPETKLFSDLEEAIGYAVETGRENGCGEYVSDEPICHHYEHGAIVYLTNGHATVERAHA